MNNSQWERTDDEKKICQALEKVAKEVGATYITSGMPFELDRPSFQGP